MTDKEKLSILLVEDDQEDYMITRDFITDARPGQLELTWAADYETALRALERTRPDVILVDYHLGAHTGLDFVRSARERGCRVPAILLTGRSSFEMDMESMKAGVSDYLEKGQLSAPLLERAIRYAIERQQIQASLEGLNEQLEARVQERTHELADAKAKFEEIFSVIHMAVAYLDRNYNFIRVNQRYAQADNREECFFPGKNHFDLYPDVENERIFREVRDTGTPYTAYAKPFVYPNHPERGVTYWDWSLQPVKEPGGEVSALILSLVDVTERRQAEEQARKAFTRLEAQAELTRLLEGAFLDYRKMLEMLVCRVSEWIGDACVVTQLSKDRQSLVPVAFYHPDPGGARLMRELLAQTTTRVGEGFSGIAAQVGTPVLIPFVPQEDIRERVKPEYWPYLDQFGIYSVLIVPLRIHDQLIGTLGVTRDQPGRPYTTEDQVFLEALAGHAALWIANAALYEEAQTELAERRRVEEELHEIQRRLTDGTEAERLRLARDLHDGPIQDLYGLSLQLRMLDNILPGGEDGETMVGLQVSIQRVIDSLRATSMELRPPVLTRFGLGAAIRSYCEQFQKMQPGLAIHLDLNEEGAQQEGHMPSERVRLALFRILQMALTNIARHAHASQATIRLWEEEEMVILEAQDDGAGFQVPDRWVELARQGHLGLLGAIERAESLGGRMQVLSSPGAGTIIRVSLPRGA